MYLSPNLIFRNSDIFLQNTSVHFVLLSYIGYIYIYIYIPWLSNPGPPCCVMRSAEIFTNHTDTL